MKNILPQDTRSIELISSWSLFIIGLSLMVAPIDTDLFKYNTHNFWSIITIMFGGLQFISVAFCKELPLVRTLTSWTIGFFFVWLGVSSISHSQALANYVAIILGFGNWYAFILNINFMRKEWIS